MRSQDNFPAPLRLENVRQCPPDSYTFTRVSSFELMNRCVILFLFISLVLYRRFGCAQLFINTVNQSFEKWQTGWGRNTCAAEEYDAPIFVRLQ